MRILLFTLSVLLQSVNLVQQRGLFLLQSLQQVLTLRLQFVKALVDIRFFSKDRLALTRMGHELQRREGLATQVTEQRRSNVPFAGTLS